jgi:hypothetical protein
MSARGEFRGSTCDSMSGERLEAELTAGRQRLARARTDGRVRGRAGCWPAFV